MRILHVIESLEIGGAEMVVVDLVNRMIQGHDVAVCCVKKKGPLTERLSKNVPIHCLDKGEGNDIAIPFKLARLIAHDKFDVVHSHSWGAFIEAVWGGRLGGAKTIIHTAHGHLGHYSAVKVKKTGRQISERVTAKLVDHIVTVSGFLKSHIISELALPPHKIKTVYNGVDCNDIHTNERTSKSCLTVTTVGRLAAVKNYGMLLNGFANAQQKTSTPMRLIFVGDGPERTVLETLANELGIADKTIFLGFRDDVNSILSDSDIFILTSHYEGISIAVLEAMRSGLPIIATSVGGNTETVEDGVSGLLVPDNDYDKLTKAMVILAQNPELRSKYGDNGIKRVKERFNLDKAVEEYLSLYSRKLI